MARAEKSIVVRVPAAHAFRHWTTYEELPEFLDGVTGVARGDGDTLTWDVEIAGRPQRWRAHVMAEPLEERRMPSEDAPPPAGAETAAGGPDAGPGAEPDPDAGELPFSEHGRRIRPPMVVRDDGEALLSQVDDAEPVPRVGADDLDVVRDPDAERPPSGPDDANRDDNLANWSRTAD